MADDSKGVSSSGLSLVDIDSQRTPEGRSLDGKSGKISYQIEYHKDDGISFVYGKITEIGSIPNSNRIDLQALVNKGYTHYGIFRLEDRSTTTIVQDKNDFVFKALSLGRNNIQIAHPVTITEKLSENKIDSR